MEQKINKYTVYTISILFISTWSSWCMHCVKCGLFSEVCYFCTARGLIPKILFDFKQASWMHLPLAHQTKSTIQNSHDWWASITEFSWLGCSNKQSNVSVVLQSSQITRRLLTYSCLYIKWKDTAKWHTSPLKIIYFLCFPSIIIGFQSWVEECSLTSTMCFRAMPLFSCTSSLGIVGNITCCVRWAEK